MSRDVDATAALATALNTASDELNQAIELAEAELQKLNLGVEAWTTWPKARNSLGYRLGYGKHGSGGWRLLAQNSMQPIPLADAPRAVRVALLADLPTLLSFLVAEANRLHLAIRKLNPLGIVRDLFDGPAEDKTSPGTPSTEPRAKEESPKPNVWGSYLEDS